MPKQPSASVDRQGRKRSNSEAGFRPVPEDCVVVRGARTHNLSDIDVAIPRNAMVVFTGVSGSGKSSLAFSTIYAEAQRRYLECVSPHARRLIDQATSPAVEAIDGLPPAVALQQNRSGTQERSSVGSATRIAVALRLLYSRAGTRDEGVPFLPAEAFSPNNPMGACPCCHGLGFVHDVREDALVPDSSKSIRQRAIASWPNGWHGKNQRDILTTLGYDVDKPWRELSKAERDWILYTDEQPNVPVFTGQDRKSVKEAIEAFREPNYMGTFVSVRRHILQGLSGGEAARKRLAPFVETRPCPDCGGKRLTRDALSVRFAGYDIADIMDLPATKLAEVLRCYAVEGKFTDSDDPAVRIAVERLASDITRRLDRLSSLGIGHLALGRRATTLSSGEAQRLRLATQLLSQLYGVVYVLDEPSAGLHPADVERLMEPLEELRRAGNSVFIVEHNLDLARRADWIVDVGPEAGRRGGKIVYSGPLAGLAEAGGSQTARYLFAERTERLRTPAAPDEWLSLKGVTANNLDGLDVDLPLARMSAITGVSGSGKSTLVSRVLPELFAERTVRTPPGDDEVTDDEATAVSGTIASGGDRLKRLVRIDQKPIGRTPRSNLATYTGLFDAVRKLFAETSDARDRGFDASRFSFNLPAGRCPVCEGQGQVSIELMYMPSVSAPCAACGGSRYNAETLAVRWEGRTIAEVLDLTVEDARPVFADNEAVARPLETLEALGLGYLRLGQPATELSGGEAQRIKLASELYRQQRGAALYLLDEPSSGLHPADMDRLLRHLDELVTRGNTVVMVEHDMRVVAQTDWVIDMGPGADRDGGKIVACGTPEDVANVPASRTAPYLRARLVV